MERKQSVCMQIHTVISSPGFLGVWLDSLPKGSSFSPALLLSEWSWFSLFPDPLVVASPFHKVVVSFVS